MKTIVRRLAGQWQLKASVALALTFGFFVPYFVLQHVHLRRPWIMPPIAFDHWIPFQSEWMAAYLSLWMYMSIAAWLTVDRDRLLRYVRGMVLLCVIGVASFLLLPTAIERPPLAEAHDRLYRTVVSFDGTANAMPSLHAAFAIFALMFNRQAITAEVAPLWLLVPNGLWCLAILYATLATKQHVVIDIVAGIAVGGGVWLVTRGGRS